MDEKPKRSTRDRKPPKYFSIDSLGTDNFGYAASTSSKDVQTPASDINSHAKILMKFLHQVNKNLRDHQIKEEVEQKERIIPESSQNGHRSMKAQHSSEPTKKQGFGRREHREESSKRDKELYPYKDQRERSEIPSSYPKNEHTQKNRAIAKNSNRTSSIASFYSPEMNSMIQQLKVGRIPVNLAAMINPNDMGEREKKAFCDAIAQQNLIQDEGLREKLRISSMEEREEKKNKLFGRSAYHIAIAYNIHLEKVKNNQNQSRHISELDPTYNSKKLKEKNKDIADYK